MGSVARSLDLMEHIATAASPPTHADMLRMFDIPKSTLSGILAELRSSGFVTLDDGRYLAGPRFTSLAYRGVGSINRQSSIRRQLEQLAAATHETTLFAVRAGKIAIVVDRVESADPIRYVPDLGVPRPLHATAVGKVFLAWAAVDLESLGPLDRLTVETNVDPVALAEELKATLRRGYAINQSESTMGVTAVAAPLMDERNALIGAVSIAGPSHRMGDGAEAAQALLSALRTMR